MHLRSRYGMEEAEYDRLLARQRSRCAVCKARTPGGRGEWRIDHDHVTGQIRGLLCNNCNSGIGMLQDDPKILRAAVQYVEQHRQMELFQRKAG
jgi:Recombination endonuclease VII